jgi:hypothetical protein
LAWAITSLLSNATGKAKDWMVVIC